MTVETAGLLLAKLLSEPGKARRLWVQRAGGGHQEKISYAAVAQVLAEHLWDVGEEPDHNQNLPRRLRDRVRRALLGQQMTWETLTWLAEAFDLTEGDRKRLADAMDQPPPLGKPLVDAVELPVANRYRTLSITEHHWLGLDRRPARHLTTQVLQGTGDEMPSYLYMFDTNTLDVRIKQGARRIGPIRQLRDDIFGVDIVLTRPLKAGETTTLTYESLFSYREPPEPEFRRAAFEGLESLDIRVEFHPQATPTRVAFARWDQLSRHGPSFEEEVPLEADCSVHRFVRSVSSTIVGFRWSWD